MGVFLCYASERGNVLLERELYLPQQWVEDGPRCRAAGVPEAICFATKPMLGKKMLERAFLTGLPCGWVAGDEVYGHDSKLRRWLEERRQPYVLLDRELYLPQQWIEDGPRCRAAGIPEEVPFQTKPMLGRRMLERAFQAGMPCGWVAADEVYGHDGTLRRWLEERRQSYVLAVAADQRLWRPDMGQHRVDEIAGTLPGRLWKRLSAGHGAKGERLYDWALLPWAEHEGWQHALLVRRSLEAEPEYAFYFTYAPQQKSTLKTMVSVAGRRWAVESPFQMAKSECGLDHYEVRHWQGWYRHITLSMLALAALTVLRAREKKPFSPSGSSQRTGNSAFARFRTAQRLAQSGASSRVV